MYKKGCQISFHKITENPEKMHWFKAVEFLCMIYCKKFYLADFIPIKYCQSATAVNIILLQ